jgi:hypothetical protein
MRTKVTVVCAMAAFVAIAGGTAQATGLIHTENIAKGAVTLDRLAPKVQKMVTAMPKNGSNGMNGADGIPGAPGAKGSTGATGATGATGPMGATGAAGAPGSAAAKGDKGDKGDDGLKGYKGDTGETGATGPQGPKGDTGLKGDKGDTGLTGATGLQGPKGETGLTGPKGETGADGTTGLTGPAGKDGKDGKDGVNGTDAPAAAYGVAQVIVQRGTAAASAWATYSTRLGSPVGDTTGGTFRFTCSVAQAPCAISVKAAVLGSSDHAFYPRVLVYKSGPIGVAGPEMTCEYGDGSNGAAPMGLTAQALSATPAYTAVPLNIGSTADCGNDPNVPAGDVATITVPSGYYDVISTFSFLA